MIPLTLELTNFLSYREPVTIDFAPIHLACIAGENGAGKSSLLEAMTWALFGKSRASSEDGVINRRAARQGEAAEVVLTFALRDAVYRIIRRRKESGRPLLEFQLQRNGGWSTVSESGVRETQAAIEQTLGMNYETFINVSFFLQGKADTFTTNNATQRKQILADLLGVNVWNTYKDRITDERRVAESNLALIERQLRDIETELQEEETRVATLEMLKVEAARIRRELTAEEQLLNQLRRAAEAVERQKKEVTRRREALARETQRLNELNQRRSERQTERDSHQALIDRRAAIEAAHAAYEASQTAFEQAQARADAVRQIEQQQRPHELTLERAQSRLAQEQQALQAQAERVAAMQTERATLRDALAQQRDLDAQLGERLTALAGEEQALQTARSALQALEADRRLLQQELTQLNRRADEITQLNAQQTRAAAEQAAAAVALVELDARLQTLAAQRGELAEVTAERGQLEAAQPALRAELKKLGERRDRLQGNGDGHCPLCGQPLTDAHRAEVLADIEGDYARLMAAGLANKQRLATLDDTRTRLEQALALAERVERSVQQRRQEQTRAELQLTQATEQLAAWEASGAAQRLAELRGQLADESALHAVQARVSAHQQALAVKAQVERDQQAAQRAAARHEARLDEITRALDLWEAGERARLAAVSAQLAANDFEPHARSALAELTRQAAAVGYDAAAHAAARAQRQALAQAPRDLQALRTAEATVQSLVSTLRDFDAQIDAQQVALTEAQQAVVEAEAQLTAFLADAGDLQGVEQRVFTLREAENAAQRRVGGAIQRVAVLDDQRERRKQWQHDRAAQMLRIQRLQMLEQACGRDGVQALLIEHALPEIEDSANDLLDRLTNGEMRISFETQRQLRTRDALRETLDIKILDSNGERPYENYSGGEQFRINFALRLALSQVLARRAGTPLQTLVIDEGFGSQDPQGRQRLVEAIRAVQDDFERILVITHVEELRDAFPVRIEVSKGAHGSRVRIAGLIAGDDSDAA